MSFKLYGESKDGSSKLIGEFEEQEDAIEFGEAVESNSKKISIKTWVVEQ